MSRFSRKILALIIAAAVIALIVFMLLFAGILTIMSLLPYQIASIVIALLTMLVLIPTVVLARHHWMVWRMHAAFATPMIVGAAGMLFNTIVMLFINPGLLPVLFFLIALNFFFLVLLVGGFILLLTEHIKMQLRNCDNNEDAQG